MSEIRITIDSSNAREGFSKLNRAIKESVVFGVSEAAKQLLIDARPRIPMLTGALRDSGHLEESHKDYAVALVWDAANPASGYIYAERQYSEILQHVDGLYAAKWVERTLRDNPGRYAMVAARGMSRALRALFSEEGS